MSFHSVPVSQNFRKWVEEDTFDSGDVLFFLNYPCLYSAIWHYCFPVSCNRSKPFKAAGRGQFSQLPPVHKVTNSHFTHFKSIGRPWRMGSGFSILGPPKGPFGAKTSPFGGRRGPLRVPSAWYGCVPPRHTVWKCFWCHLARLGCSRDSEGAKRGPKNENLNFAILKKFNGGVFWFFSWWIIDPKEPFWCD